MGSGYQQNSVWCHRSVTGFHFFLFLFPFSNSKLNYCMVIKILLNCRKYISVIQCPNSCNCISRYNTSDHFRGRGTSRVRRNFLFEFLYHNLYNYMLSILIICLNSFIYLPIGRMLQKMPASACGRSPLLWMDHLGLFLLQSWLELSSFLCILYGLLLFILYGTTAFYPCFSWHQKRNGIFLWRYDYFASFVGFEWMLIVSVPPLSFHCCEHLFLHCSTSSY